jgi:TolB-like protein
MKTRVYFIFVATIMLICWTIPDASWSQIGVRIKRSNELTRSASLLFQQQKIDEAKEQLSQAIRLNPKNVIAHELLALVYYQEHNFQEAKNQANIAIKLNKKSPKALYVLGMINFQQGNNELARTQLKLAVNSLKEPEYRQRAKNMLEKMRENTREKRPGVSKSDLPSREEITETPIQEVDYKPYIAVFPFEDANARTEFTKLGQSLTEMLITSLINEDKFNVMERVQLEKILKEQSLSQTGVIDAETAIEVGKLSGLEAVVVGSISQLKTSIEADARLIEVETGKALAAASSSVNRVDDIRGLANDLASQLSAKAHLIVPEADTTKVKNPEIEMQKW